MKDKQQQKRLKELDECGRPKVERFGLHNDDNDPPRPPSHETEWAQSFKERQKHEIVIRTPEPTSIHHMTNFNEHDVNSFFSNLEEAFMKHFVKHAKPSAEHPVLLILDNHQSYVNANVINYVNE